MIVQVDVTFGRLWLAYTKTPDDPHPARTELERQRRVESLAESFDLPVVLDRVQFLGFVAGVDGVWDESFRNGTYPEA